jgi:hypothetical protein
VIVFNDELTPEAQSEGLVCFFRSMSDVGQGYSIDLIERKNNTKGRRDIRTRSS